MVGFDYIYFFNNKKCIIYNIFYLIIYRVYVVVILIGFILKCYISLNFWLKFIGKLFFGYFSFLICFLIFNFKMDLIKMVYGI